MLLMAFKVLFFAALIILVIGLIKPKWVLFWMKNPDRLTLSSFVLIMVMVAVTGYSKLALKPKPKDESAEHSRDKMSRDQQNEINMHR